MSGFHRLATLSILILLIALLPAAANAITVKGEVMHAADWTIIPCAISVCEYYYDDLDFPVDSTMNGNSGDRLYIQVYRDGIPLEMIDYSDDGLPNSNEASIEFINVGPANDERETSKVRIYISSSTIHSPDSGDNTYTIDYYWNGKKLYEELSYTGSSELEYPCNQQGTTDSCEDESDITIYEYNGTTITQCATSGSGCIYSVSQVDDSNWFGVTLSGTSNKYSYYASYEFNGLVEKEYLGEHDTYDCEDNNSWDFFHPRFPVTHLGSNDPNASDDNQLKIYFGSTQNDPLTRCVNYNATASNEHYGSLVSSDYIVSATNTECLTTNRMELLEAASSGECEWELVYRSRAVLSNVASGKGKDQVPVNANGYPIDKWSCWYIEGKSAGDYWITYFTDMSINALPVALGRGDDAAALDLDEYIVYYPNILCLDYLDETYDHDTCKNAFADSNVCARNNALDKCLTETLDPDNLQQSWGTRYYQQLDTSIYYPFDGEGQANIRQAVFAKRNGVVMLEKDTINEFNSPHEVVFTCINTCTIPDDEWRVYVNNGLGDPEDYFPPTMHAFNPWSLNATDRAPTWFNDKKNDGINDINVDIFTVLNNIGFQSTSIMMGGGSTYSGDTTTVTTNKQTAENNLFGTQSNVLQGLIGAYELQGSIDLYLEHTLFSYWYKDDLTGDYGLSSALWNMREGFWTADSVWEGSNNGGDANGILDLLNWMTNLVEGYPEYNHEAHSIALRGLEFDFEPTNTDEYHLGEYFFEPFYPYHERTGLLAAIEQRGRQMRETISETYPHLTILAYFNEQMFINPAVQAFIRGLTTRTYLDGQDVIDLPIAGGIHIFTSSSYRVPYDSTQTTWEENIQLVGKGPQTVLLLTQAIDDDPESQSDWDLTGGIEWGSTFVSWWDISKSSDPVGMNWNYDGTPSYGMQNWLAMSYESEFDSLEKYLETELLPYCDEHLVFPLMNNDILWLYPKDLSDTGIRGTSESNCNSINEWPDCSGDIWPWMVNSRDFHVQGQTDFYQLQYWNGTDGHPCDGFNEESDSPWGVSVGWLQVGLRGRWGVDISTYSGDTYTYGGETYYVDDYYCGGSGWEPPTATMMNGNDPQFIDDLKQWADSTY